MKSERYSQSSIQTILERLDCASFVQLAGIDMSECVTEGQEGRCYCPICRDRAKRTLVIECDTRRAYCTNLHCQASNMNKGGGNLLDMFALLQGLDMDDAINKAAQALSVPLVKQDGASSGSDLSAEKFIYVEVGHYVPGDDESIPWQPVPLTFQGKEALGRGMLIEESQVQEFSIRYKTDVLQSHFLFDTDDKSVRDSLADQNAIPLLGDFYVVFNASSSAEIVHAINQAIDLVERLKQNYDIPYDAVNVFYTSSHIEVHVDYTVFGITPMINLPEVYRRMTCAVIGVDPVNPERSAAFSQIDLDVYHYDRMTNIPGSVVSTSTRQIYKIRMSYGAFKKMSYQRLHEFSLRRQDQPERERFMQVSSKGQDFYHSVTNSMLRDTRGVDESDTIASLFYRVTEADAGVSTLKALAPTLLRRLFDESRQPLLTPSMHLNSALSGGLYPGHLYIVAGFPGSGVSTLCLQIMNYVASQQDTQCFFVGLQRGVEEVYKRSLSHIGKIPVTEIDQKRQNPAELYDDKDFNRRIFNAYENYQMFADNITILEGAMATSLSRLAQLIVDRREEMLAHGKSTSSILLVIDSLQLMVAMMRALYTEQRMAGEMIPAELTQWDVVSLTSRLKALARELDIIVLCTFEHYTTHRMLAAELSESNPAVQDLMLSTEFADTVMVMSRQGASLLNLMDFFKTHLTGTPLESTIDPTAAKLNELEKAYRGTREFKALRSEFAVMDIVKNRSGQREKILFVYHKPTSHFEPLYYLPKSENSE